MTPGVKRAIHKGFFFFSSSSLLANRSAVSTHNKKQQHPSCCGFHMVVGVRWKNSTEIRLPYISFCTEVELLSSSSTLPLLWGFFVCFQKVSTNKVNAGGWMYRHGLALIHSWYKVCYKLFDVAHCVYDLEKKVSQSVVSVWAMGCDVLYSRPIYSL